MKKIPFLTFAVALTAGVASIVGYALLGNPARTEAAGAAWAPPTSARPEAALPGGAKTGAPFSSSAGQAPRGTLELAGGPRPATRAGDAGTRFQPTSTGMTDESGAGIEPGADSAQVQPASTGRPAAEEVASPRVAIPAAFRPLPAEGAAANSQLAASVQGLQQNFVNDLGGTNQDPRSPAYRKRWIAAQANSDEQYRLLVGNQTYLIEQTQVNNQ